MKRKIYLGLAPLLVIALLGAMAGAAQAAPRILQNGTEKKLEEGAHFPILSWGVLQLENSKLGLIECHNAFGGYATDPGKKGSGKPGEGKVEGYTAYGCTSPICEAALGKVVVTPVGKEEAKKVERITVAEPWEAVITEPVPSSEKWTLKVGNKLEPRPQKGQIAFEVICAVQATKAEFTGELNIGGVQGQAQGSSPAKLIFEKAASGELQSAIGTGTVAGEVNLFGYSEGQTLTVKNQ